MFQGLRRYRKIVGHKNKQKAQHENEVEDEEIKHEEKVTTKRHNEYGEEIISAKQTKKESGLTEKQMDIVKLNSQKFNEDEDGLEYEDGFEDEYDEEAVDDVEDVEDEEWEEGDMEKQLADQFGKMKFSETPVIYEPLQKKTNKILKPNENAEVFLGTNKDLKEGEVLEYDNDAYELYHRITTEWPCLSFDLLIPENKPFQIVGPKRQLISYPLTVYSVAGCQAEPGKQNAVYFMKWSELHKTKYDDDSADDILDAEDADHDADGVLNTLSIRHQSPVNRIRSMNGTGVVALWSEDGSVCIYDGTKHLENLVNYEEAEEDEWVDEEDDKKKKSKSKVPNPSDPNKKNFLSGRFNHKTEGYALQWSPHVAGLLSTGNCNKEIHFYKVADEGGSGWIMDETPYLVHNGSVEDIQFSPNQNNVIASCSTDGTIKFIDFRDNPKNQFAGSIKASKTDVNVITWNNNSPHLLGSGHDDGTISIWDIRFLKKGRSIAEIQWHKEAITSIDFQPFEESVIAASSSDNRVTVWDFSVEADLKNKTEIPDQLMFIHQGIEDVKEIRHHPLLPDVILTTALNGFNVFKPNYEEVEAEY